MDLPHGHHVFAAPPEESRRKVTNHLLTGNDPPTGMILQVYAPNGTGIFTYLTILRS